MCKKLTDNDVDTCQCYFRQTLDRKIIIYIHAYIYVQQTETGKSIGNGIKDEQRVAINSRKHCRVKTKQEGRKGKK